MTDQMNLLITDRKTGAKYTDSQSDLRQIWEDHYRVIDKGDEEPDIYIPEEYQAECFGLMFQDGTIQINGWVEDGTPCEPIPLNPERFSISLQEVDLEKEADNLLNVCFINSGVQVFDKPNMMLVSYLRFFADRIRADERSRQAVPVMDYEKEARDMESYVANKWLHSDNDDTTNWKAEWLRSFASRLTSQVGQGWKKMEWFGQNYRIGERLVGQYKPLFHYGSDEDKPFAYRGEVTIFNNAKVSIQFNTPEEAQHWVEQTVLSELTSLRVKESETQTI